MFLDQQSTCSPYSSPAFPSPWKEIPLYPPLSWFLQAQDPMHSQVGMDSKLQERVGTLGEKSTPSAEKEALGTLSQHSTGRDRG